MLEHGKALAAAAQQYVKVSWRGVHVQQASLLSSTSWCSPGAHTAHHNSAQQAAAGEHTYHHTL
jgi:hypothetical protein